MKYDVGIIGSGPAGLSAAIYAKRANLSAVVIEKEYEGTGQIAESGRVDNYLGMPGISGYDLGETFREHAVKLEVEFLEQEVTRIQKEESGQFQMTFSDSSVIESKTVIYAAGASPRRVDIPGEKEYVGKGVSYCAICDGSFYRGKKVAVLGGGDTALDDAAYLAGLAVGYWKDTEEIKENWQLDRVFTASMPQEKRQELVRSWKRAVDCALYYAKWEEEHD